MKLPLLLAICLWATGCTTAKHLPRPTTPLVHTWDTSTELAKFPRAQPPTSTVPNIWPRTQRSHPLPAKGLSFSGELVFDLVIDAHGKVVAALPKKLDGRCSADLQTLTEQVINPLRKTLLLWMFFIPPEAQLQRHEHIVMVLPIEFQEPPN